MKRHVSKLERVKRVVDGEVLELKLDLLFCVPRDVQASGQSGMKRWIEDREKKARQIIEAFDRGDGVRFATGFCRDIALHEVLCNFDVLKRRGILETAVVPAWRAAKENNRFWSMHDVESVVAFDCDMKRLRDTGDRLPPAHEGIYTLYRGVSGKGKSRRVCGLSWTGTLSVACWFARRYGETRDLDPAVYRVEMEEEWVYWYDNKFYEDEYVCSPTGRPTRLQIDRDTMDRLAAEHEKSIKQHFSTSQ